MGPKMLLRIAGSRTHRLRRLGYGTPIEEVVTEMESASTADAAVSLVMHEVFIGGPAGSTGPMVGAPSSPS
jgi:hypothetical protein